MMNMNINNLSNTNDQSLNMSSQPSSINIEHVHYYVDFGGEEEHPVDIEGQEGEDNGNEIPAIADPPGNTPVLDQFLRLPMERVQGCQSTGTPNYLRLGRSSHLLTSYAYMDLMVEVEQKKRDMEAIK